MRKSTRLERLEKLGTEIDQLCNEWGQFEGLSSLDPRSLMRRFGAYDEPLKSEIRQLRAALQWRLRRNLLTLLDEHQGAERGQIDLENMDLVIKDLSTFDKNNTIIFRSLEIIDRIGQENIKFAPEVPFQHLCSLAATEYLSDKFSKRADERRARLWDSERLNFELAWFFIKVIFFVSVFFSSLVYNYLFISSIWP